VFGARCPARAPDARAFNADRGVRAAALPPNAIVAVLELALYFALITAVVIALIG
jgi:hypothetical protein